MVSQETVDLRPVIDKAWRVVMEWMRGHHLIINQIGTVGVDIDGTLTLQNWALGGVTDNWFESLTKHWEKERTATKDETLLQLTHNLAEARRVHAEAQSDPARNVTTGQALYTAQRAFDDGLTAYKK